MFPTLHHELWAETFYYVPNRFVEKKRLGNETDAPYAIKPKLFRNVRVIARKTITLNTNRKAIA
jgi:hypothetical protein